MCFIQPDLQLHVTEEVTNFLNKEEPFTGHDVFFALRNRLEASTLAQVQIYGAATVVSAAVRELFNRGSMPGWASTQVVPEKGPVLYFKVTPAMKAAKVAKSIRHELEERSCDDQSVHYTPGK